MARLLPILALSAVGAACSAILDLPQPPEEAKVTISTIVSERPASDPAAPVAFADDVLTIEGEGFDPDPLRNEVRFPLARTQPFAVDGATLKVRVPPDAGSGPITVSTVSKQGQTSSQTFKYLGLGHPRRAVEGSRRVFRYAPGWTGEFAGAFLAHSAEFGSIVDLTLGLPLDIPPLCSDCERPFLFPPVVLPFSGLIVRAEQRGRLRSGLWQPGGALVPGPEAPSAGRLDFFPNPDPASGLLWAVAGDASGMNLLRLSPQRFPAIADSIPVDPSVRVTPIDQDRVLLLDAGADHKDSWVLDLRGAAPEWLPVLDDMGYPVRCDAAATLRRNDTTRIFCVPWVGHRTNVRIFDLADDGSTPATRPALQVPLPESSVLEIVAAPDRDAGGQVVVALREKGVVLALSPDDLSIRWGFHDVREPSGLSWVAGGRVIVVADATSRDVWVLDPATGSVLDRYWSGPEFGVPRTVDPRARPARLGNAPEARGIVSDPVHDPLSFRVATPSMPQLGFRLDSASMAPEELQPPQADAFFVATRSDPSGFEDRFAYRLDGHRLTSFFGDVSNLDIRDTPMSVDRSASGVIGIAFRQRVELWSATERIAASGPELISDEPLAFHPTGEGRWIAAVRLASKIQLLSWTEEELMVSPQPSQTLDLPGCTDLFWAQERIEVKCNGGRKQVGFDLVQISEVLQDPTWGAGFVVSPDGRHVAFQSPPGRAPSLIVARLEPGKAMRLEAEIPVPYGINGLAFDPTGERLLVVSGDTLIRVE